MEKEFTNKKRERDKDADDQGLFNEKKENIDNPKEEVTEKKGKLAKIKLKQKLEDNNSTEQVFKNTNVEPGKCLLISNLQRPFAKQHLEALVNKYGKVQKIWIDLIKTHCYVEFSSTEDAKNALENISGITWPQEGKKLLVNYVPQSELNDTIEKDKSPYDKEKKVSIGKDENIVRGNNVKENRERKQESSTNVIEEPVKTLDNLFRKTVTKPQIYYLPLSELEVEDKKNKIKIK